MKLSSTLLLSTALLCGASLHAADFHVTTSQELQNALTTSTSNGVDDTIFLAAGAYQGNFNFQTSEGQNLTIQGEAGVLPEDITLDGGGVGGALNLNCSAAVNVTLQGFTILRNSGDDDSRHALVVRTSDNVTIENVNFFGNGNMRGPAGQIDGSNGVFLRGISTLLTENAEGDPLEIINMTGDVEISGSTFESVDNHRLLEIRQSGSKPNQVSINDSSFSLPVDASYYAVYIDSMHLNLVGSSIQGGYGIRVEGNNSNDSVIDISNTDFSNGKRGLDLVYTSGSTIENCTFRNYSQNAVVLSYSGITFVDSIFENCSGSSGGAIGGSSWLEIFRCSFRDCRATASSDAGGGAVHTHWYLRVEDSVFENCTTADVGGAIIMTKTSQDVVLRRNKFIGCSSGASGGAAYLVANNILLENNLVVDNVADGWGGGFWLKPEESALLKNNTITRNSSSGNGGGIRVDIPGDTQTLEVYNNIIWGNSAAGEGGDIFLSGFGNKVAAYNTFSDVGNVFDDATQGNIDVAPIFFNPDAGDFHVRVGSLTIDAGDNQYVEEGDVTLDGQTRIVGSAVDMGCFEFDNTGKHPADADENGIITQAEFDAYSAAWRTDASWPTGPSPVPADYLTRAGFILNEGGNYFNDGGGLPIGWKPGTN